MSRFPILLCGLAFALLLRAETPAEDTDATQARRAIALIEQLRDGDYETSQKDFDDAMKNALPPDRLEQTWRSIMGQTGRLLALQSAGASDHEGYRIHHVDCSFERGELVADVVFSAQGQVAGLFFRPKPPEIADQ
ncbi:MAG TPA: DUF3887 domain-containing protein [Xanthomonadaceae bacterium]|nr:DUF3887 domain-containing protein [Xanthomonadaceae bacterium]